MRRIAICNCGEPLISTCAFSGAEYFCRTCKSSFGMIDVQRVELSPELKLKKEANDKWWEKLYKDWVPPTAYRVGCPKCEGMKERHVLHMTEKAKEKSQNAYTEIMKEY